MLRFAGRSPLRDSSHTEEAGIRFFRWRKKQICRAPRTLSLGIGGAGLALRLTPHLRLGALIFSPEAACGDAPTAESSARLSREAAALVRWTILPVVHSHFTGRVKWGWEIECLMLGERRVTWTHGPAESRSPLWVQTGHIGNTIGQAHR